MSLEKLMDRKRPLPSLEKHFTQGYENGIERFYQALVNKLNENLNKYGLGNSKLASSARITVTDDGIYISMDSEYAMFVEYGTGVVGEGFSHPKANIHGWEYDTNQHGDKGWYYPTTEDDPNPTKRYKNGEWWAWTAGQESKPFMYDTWLWATQSINNMITSDINKELAKWESDMK